MYNVKEIKAIKSFLKTYENKCIYLSTIDLKAFNASADLQ